MSKPSSFFSSVLSFLGNRLADICAFFGKLGIVFAGTWTGLHRAAERLMALAYEKFIAERPRLILTLLTLLWLIPGSAQLPFVDRDEPRFAYATQEMIDRGEAVVPTFNGENRFDKPPFVYWWMRLNYLMPGMNEFSARFHSILATVAVVLLIWGFASRLYNRTIAFWSAFAFLTCLQVFIHGRLCVADMPMMIFIVAAQWAAWELLQKPSWRWAFLFWGSLALGFTTKWIVPWAVVGVTLMVYGAMKAYESAKNNSEKNKANESLAGNSFVKISRFAELSSAVTQFKPVSGLIFMTVLILAWAIPAWMTTNGEFFKVGVGEHVIARGEMAFNARPYNPAFYLLTAFMSLLPWIAFAGGLVGLFKASFDDRTKFLVAWAGGTYLLFSLAQTQLPHYVLPAFPALLIMIVVATHLQKPAGLWAGRFFTAVFWLWTSVLVVATLIIALVPIHDDVLLRVKLSGLCLVFALAALTGLGYACARNNSLRITVLFLATPLFFWGSAALLTGLSPGEQVAVLLHKQEIFPEPLIANGFEEPSLTAYAQAKWLNEPDYEKAKAAYAAAPNAALVVLAQEFTIENVWRKLMKLPLHARRDNERLLLKSPPLGGRRVRLEGVNLGRFSVVVYEVYVK